MSFSFRLSRNKEIRNRNKPKICLQIERVVSNIKLKYFPNHKGSKIKNQLMKMSYNFAEQKLYIQNMQERISLQGVIIK